MKYAILFISIIFTITSNIAGRFLKKTQIKNNVYIKNKFLLKLYYTKRKILFSAYINYIVQLILTLILMVLIVIDWTTNTSFIINNIWLYVCYSIISLTSIAISGICNKWNY